MQVIYMHSLYYKIGGYITKELCYHNTNMIIHTKCFHDYIKHYAIYMQYIYYHCIKDIHYFDSIVLWPVNTTPKGMYVHDLESTYSLPVG